MSTRASTSRVKDEPVDGTSDDSIRSGYVVLGCSVRLTTAHEKIVADKVKGIQSQEPIYVAAMDKTNLSSALAAADRAPTRRRSMDDGFTPGGGGGGCGGECEVNYDGVCEVCAFWRELASYKPKADGAKQLPVAASDDRLGLMERAGNLLERAEAALERLSLPPVVVPVEPTLSLVSGDSADCADGAIEHFGCYSPRDVCLSALARALESTSMPIASSEHVSPAVQGPPMKDRGVEMPLALGELRGSDAPSPEEKIAKVLAQYDVFEPQEMTLPCSMVELCREIADMPKDKQLRMDVPSLAERRSIRLDKKNKDCVIPAAKRAECRRAEAFGEIPKLKSKEKATDEAIEEKMQFYLQMYKKQRTPQVMEALRELVSIPLEVGSHLRNMIPESEPDKLQDKDLHIFSGTKLASFKNKAGGAKQFPVAASDDSLQSIPQEVGGHLRNMIPESEPDKLQEKDLHIFSGTEQVTELSSSDDDDDDMVRGGTREYCRAQMRVTQSCAKKQKITSTSSPSTKPGYGARKPHDRAPIVGSEPLSSNLGGFYILQRGATLSLQAKKKVEEKVQVIRPKLPIFVKVMSRSSVDGTGCKTCEMIFGSEYGECLPNKSRKLVLQLEGKGRQWQATLDIRSDICFLQRKISKGWKEFSGQNGLKVGDICLFQLEDTNTTSLKMMVYLIRKSQIEL